MRCSRRPTRPSCRRTLVALLLVTAMLPLAAPPARAHQLAIGQSEIVQDGDVVRYDLAVGYAELAKRVADLAAPVGSGDDDERRSLRAAQTAVASYLGRHVQVLNAGMRCDSALEALDTVRHRGELFAVLQLAYRCPSSAPASFEVRYDLFVDEQSAGEQIAHASLAR